VFDYAAYPLSLLALATSVHLALMVRGRWLAAGLAGLAAGLTYPLGLLIALSSGVWLLVDRRAALRERLRRGAIVSGLTACGGAVLVLVQRAHTGSWEAFFLVQAKYAHSWHSPVTSLRTNIYDVRTASPLLQLSTVPPLQSLFLAFVLGCVLLALVLRRPRLQRNDLLIGLWALATWALPQAETGISRYRSEAALVPLAVLLPRLPRRVAILLALVAVAIAVPMAQLFLRGQLR
jgi:hypothetical protein